MVYSVPEVCHPATRLSRPRPILFWAGPTLTVMDKEPEVMGLCATGGFLGRHMSWGGRSEL